MFGMSGTEMIIILVLALLLLGPEKLPEMAKLFGKGMREFRDSNRMRFQFPGTGARDWNIGLNGSGAVTNAFDRCRNDMTR